MRRPHRMRLLYGCRSLGDLANRCGRDAPSTTRWPRARGVQCLIPAEADGECVKLVHERDRSASRSRIAAWRTWRFRAAIATTISAAQTRNLGNSPCCLDRVDWSTRANTSAKCGRRDQTGSDSARLDLPFTQHPGNMYADCAHRFVGTGGCIDFVPDGGLGAGSI